MNTLDTNQIESTPTAAELFEPAALAAQRLASALRNPQTENILAAWRQLKALMEFEGHRA
jgi:hypothetical protein